jgi:hypothetical protein
MNNQRKDMEMSDKKCEPDLMPWDELEERYQDSIDECLSYDYKELLAGIKRKLNKQGENGRFESEHFLAALQVKYILDSNKVQKGLLSLTKWIGIFTFINLAIFVMVNLTS